MQEKRLLPLRYGVARFKNGTIEDRIDYQITVNTPISGEPVIFSPAPCHIIEFPSFTAAIDGYATLYAPETIRRKSFYTITTHAPAPTGYVLPHPHLNDRDRYLRIPESLRPAVHTALQAAVPEDKDARDTIGRIQYYLRTYYVYTQRYMEVDHPSVTLEDFLLREKQGHCEYFAAAAVMLLRASDIPARYVTGYSPTPLNPVTGYCEVRGDMGHAWAEAWIDGDWVQVEATPENFCAQCTASGAEGPMSEALQTYVRHLHEMPGVGTVTWAVLGFFEEALGSLNAVIRWGVIDLGTALREYGRIFLMLIIVGIAALLLWRRYWVQLLHRYRIRRIMQALQTLENGAPRTVIVNGYALLEAYLQLTATGRDPAWTPEKYRKELIKRHSNLDKTALTQIFRDVQLLIYADRVAEGFDPQTFITQIRAITGKMERTA